jgi:predicted ATPase/class 3 adenylate cyclase
MTFLFTDVEGSTRLWEEHAESMRGAIERHDELVATAIGVHNGEVFTTAGDSFAAAFSAPADALAAAVDAQRALTAEPWPSGVPIRARMALHSGGAHERGGDYFGPTLNRTARIMSVAHGGQLVASEATVTLLGGGDSRVGTVTFNDLGQHRLRDLQDPERVFGVRAPGIEADFAQLRSLDAFKHNLPLQRTEFVGREAEVRTVLDLVRQRSLVTLTAVGGAGKTRVALQVGAAAVGDMVESVSFVDLSVVDDPEQVEQVIGTAVAMPAGFGLVAFLRDRNMLVILDNCEHLIDECAAIVDDLLVGCPSVKILATSREALQVPGEQMVPLGPLDPEHDGLDLFLARARLLDPSYDPDDATRQTIVDICARLDGIPLAVELAAARTRDLSPPALLSKLGDRFSLLSGGRRRTGRQRTLEAAIDWSHDLLEDRTRILFRRLSTFFGSASIEEIEAVCADERQPPSMVGTELRRLVDCNLVVATPGATSTQYSLLETIRVYAHDRLIAADEQRTTRDRHLACYLERASEMLSSLDTIAPERFAHLLLNAAGAIDHALDTNQDRHAIDLYVVWGGLLEDGSATSSTRREHAGPAAARLGDWAIARLDYTDIERNIVLGHTDECYRLATEMFESPVPEDFDSPDGRYVQSYWAYLHQYVALSALADDPVRSLALSEKALPLTEGDPFLREGLEAARVLALLHANGSRTALTALEAAEPGHQTVWVLTHMTLLHIAGRHREAAACLADFDRSVGIFGFSSYQAIAAIADEYVGNVASANGRLEVAVRFAKSSPTPHFASYALAGLGAIINHRGDPDRAIRFLTAATQLGTTTLSLRPLCEHHLDAIGAASGTQWTAAHETVDSHDVTALLDEGLRLLLEEPLAQDVDQQGRSFKPA